MRVPRFRVVPGCGDCEITVSCGWSEARYTTPAFNPAELSCRWATSCGWPVTSGTATDDVGAGGGGGGGGAPPPLTPFETLSRTLDFAGTRFPRSGACATTVPLGWDDGTKKPFGTSPAPRPEATASSRDCPIVAGTVTSPREIRMIPVAPPAT